MSPATLQIRGYDPLLTVEQWLRVARRLELSEREFQIVRLVFEDEHERSIASLLGISLHTVHTHLKHLHRKLGVRSRVGLVLRIVREYLADDGQDQPDLPWLLPRFTQKAA